MSMGFTRTAPAISLTKFMKTWFVAAGRTTPLERDHYSATETYQWNDKEDRIDIVYRARAKSFDGKERVLRQKGWVQNSQARTHWKIRPHFLPIKFDYLILAIATDYRWAAIGVPNEKYLWILSEKPILEEADLAEALSDVKSLGYPVHDVERKPQIAPEEGAMIPVALRSDLKKGARPSKVKRSP